MSSLVKGWTDVSLNNSTASIQKPTFDVYVSERRREARGRIENDRPATAGRKRPAFTEQRDDKASTREENASKFETDIGRRPSSAPLKSHSSGSEKVGKSNRFRRIDRNNATRWGYTYYVHRGGDKLKSLKACSNSNVSTIELGFPGELEPTRFSRDGTFHPQMIVTNQQNKRLPSQGTSSGKNLQPGWIPVPATQDEIFPKQTRVIPGKSVSTSHSSSPTEYLGDIMVEYVEENEEEKIEGIQLETQLKLERGPHLVAFQGFGPFDDGIHSLRAQEVVLDLERKPEDTFSDEHELERRLKPNQETLEHSVASKQVETCKKNTRKKKKKKTNSSRRLHLQEGKPRTKKWAAQQTADVVVLQSLIENSKTASLRPLLQGTASSKDHREYLKNPPRLSGVAQKTCPGQRSTAPTFVHQTNAYPLSSAAKSSLRYKRGTHRYENQVDDCHQSKNVKQSEESFKDLSDHVCTKSNFPIRATTAAKRFLRPQKQPSDTASNSDHSIIPQEDVGALYVSELLSALTFSRPIHHN